MVLTFFEAAVLQNWVYMLLKTAVFLLIASVAIKLASSSARTIAGRRYGSEAVKDLAGDLTKVLLWFTSALIVLSILGFDGLASSLGTATGFLALGVAYALKDVIADTVAGVYLAQDSDFNPGDEVEVDSVEGEVKEVGLRKTRIEVKDGLRVINNSDVEKKWTLKK